MATHSSKITLRAKWRRGWELMWAGKTTEGCDLLAGITVADLPMVADADEPEKLLAKIQAIIARESSAHWVAHLEAAGVPCAPIQDLTAVMAEPQTSALGMIEAVPGADLSLVGLPLSFDGARPPMRHRAPKLGEHNREILGEDGPASPRR